MGTKTAYANNGLVAFRDLPKYPDRLVHVNALFRHGTRSPGDKLLEMMEKLAETLKLRKELSDFNFTFNCRGSGPMELLPAGVQELEKLGLRLRRRLPRDFRLPLNAKVYVSPTNRTKDSAKAFVSKFFQSPWSVSYEEDSDRLRFFDGCDRYAKTIRKNKKLLGEWSAFKEGPEMKKVLADIVADNGLHDLNITLDDIEELYTMATHEASVMQADDAVSGWLKLFRPEHLYVLEYLHDLKVR
ncbi:unnamed protein product [Dibothriocephalus latus]|uniref:Multiple inositol polyphosphate phosphatase 1 n=1 Tax=Dibothriocephalus latus TaxID=60516 RepID=A0A3P7LVE1_DIBLA|nr:unnamed protein product [Dibothriocephalus latus]